MRTESYEAARNGLLKGIIRSTLIKDILRTNLNGMDSKAGKTAVRTLMGEDPEVFFALISSLSVLVNSLIGASTELALRLRDNFPPDLLKSFLASLYEDIDKDAARECCRAWADLASSFWESSPELRQAAGTFILNSGPDIKAGAVNSLARFINSSAEKDPEVFSTFISRVLAAIDTRETGRATRTLAGALLDQRWHLASWAWKLLRSRIRRRFGI